VIVKLSPDLRRILYSTFLGGAGDDVGRAGCVTPDGSLAVAGLNTGGHWPVASALQGASAGDNDAIIALLRPAKP
jgi:hypothetical protein